MEGASRDLPLPAHQQALTPAPSGAGRAGQSPSYHAADYLYKDRGHGARAAPLISLHATRRADQSGHGRRRTPRRRIGSEQEGETGLG